ncbi:DUF92 domain-containing protein [Effusibacillus pohliae]|uniref:DUF92 domain-containing protein n=1 Tax=Effusibacillus pohliae TaxID=232270 RepID=UPI00036AFE37|nr:DUF92 domain-containing protein [Effusibacillus pohliae]
MTEFITGFVGSTLIAGIAYRKRSLSLSGVLSAIAVGTTLYWLGSLAWFGTLIAFFISSSLLTKWKQKAKETAESGYEKSGRRDAGQVLANGGIGVLLCLFNSLFPHPVWWNAFVGVMASVNADTWATEIGGLSQAVPRSILTGKKVPPGTSGGVSPLGLAATAAGGLFIGGSAWLLLQLVPSQIGSRIPTGSAVDWFHLLLIGGIAGTFGSLTDSLLGARWQVMYQCGCCGKEVERRMHCGHPTLHVRGFRNLNNDMVNFLSSIAGALVAVWLGNSVFR